MKKWVGWEALTAYVGEMSATEKNNFYGTLGSFAMAAAIVPILHVISLFNSFDLSLPSICSLSPDFLVSGFVISTSVAMEEIAQSLMLNKLFVALIWLFSVVLAGLYTVALRMQSILAKTQLSLKDANVVLLIALILSVGFLIFAAWTGLLITASRKARLLPQGAQ